MSSEELIAEAKAVANQIELAGSYLAKETIRDLVAALEVAEAKLAEARSIHKVKHGEKPRYAPGDYHAEREPVAWEKYSMCQGCSALWPCPTIQALGEGEHE